MTITVEEIKVKGRSAATSHQTKRQLIATFLSMSVGSVLTRTSQETLSRGKGDSQSHLTSILVKLSSELLKVYQFQFQIHISHRPKQLWNLIRGPFRNSKTKAIPSWPRTKMVSRTIWGKKQVLSTKKDRIYHLQKVQGHHFNQMVDFNSVLIQIKSFLAWSIERGHSNETTQYSVGESSSSKNTIRS